ncbi:VOC family protein [Streptomyces sp. CA-111067]|uniref:VOC family protein n=1 Tax=Streptomyces sp. CA-111067 TaxID=3240046 RepID=UPI003D99F965
MDFVSIRVITADIGRLVAFYEKATGLPAAWATEDFAEIRTPTATLAIGSTRTVPLFTPDDPGSARPAANQSVIVEFRVEDVDQVYANLSLDPADLVQKPTTMPWGNRSLLLRDPDGTLVNLFTPTTPITPPTPTARAPREERGPSAETTR